MVMKKHKKKDDIILREESVSKIRGALDLQDMGGLKGALEGMAPEDIAEIMGEFPVAEKVLIFNALDASDAAVVLDDTDPQSRLTILQTVDGERLGQVLDEMPADEAADVMEDVPEKDREDLLALMEDEDKEEIEEILKYPENSAGRVMNPEFVYVRESNNVEDAIYHIRGLGLDEEVFYVYVVNAAMELKGAVSIGKILTVSRDTIIRSIMRPDVQSVLVDEDQEKAARIIRKYDLFSLPVVDYDNRLVGRITVDDIIDVMEEEYAEDISRMTGTIEEEHGTETTLIATHNRLPWLLTCMLGSILTGIVIQMHEVTLAETMALISFIPVITATGGNSGVQASTVVVREIALGRMDLKRVGEEVLRQIKIAVMLGVACGAVLTLLASFWKKSSMVGMIAGLSIFLVVVWSNFVGVVIPTVFKKLNIDPAIASGPLITTLNDVIGVLIYLTVASFLLGG
jgi:magnesium transporter